MSIESNPGKLFQNHTVFELSQRWRCDEETVRRRIRRGELRSTLIGGKHLISDAELARYETASSSATIECQPNTKVMRTLYIGIDPDFFGGIVGITADGTILHGSAAVSKFKKKRYLDVSKNFALLESYIAQAQAAKEEVFIALEESTKNPGFATKANHTMGRNGEFWRVVLSFLGCAHEIVHPQIWQEHFFAELPGLDSKEKAADVVKQRFPDLDYGDCSEVHRKGKNDALLIAQWAKDHNK